MFILALHLALNVSSKCDFNFVQVLVQDLLLPSLLKVATILEDGTCYVQCIYIKKQRLNFC